MKKILITLIALALITGTAYATNVFPNSLNGWIAGQTIPSSWANSLESKIGINGSADTNSLDYKIANLLTSVSDAIFASTTISTSTITTMIDKTDVRFYGAKGDGVTDDTTAIQNAINASKIVYFPAGTYIVSNLTANGTQKIFGDGKASVISFKTGSTGCMFTSTSTDATQYTNLDLDGGNNSDQSATGTNGDRTGICMNATLPNNSFSDIAVHGFTDRGISLIGVPSLLYYLNAPSFSNVSVYYNWTGIDTGLGGLLGAEYMKFSNITATQNRVGVYVRSGNNVFSSSHFDTNGYGMIIDNSFNNAHGSVVGSTFNHNTAYGLYSTSITAGFTLTGNQIWYSNIYLNGVTGITFTNNTVRHATFTSMNGGENMIKNNWFGSDVTVSRSGDTKTIWGDNYTNTGYDQDLASMIVDNSVVNYTPSTEVFQTGKLLVSKDYNGLTDVNVSNLSSSGGALSGFKFSTKDGYSSLLQTNDGWGSPSLRNSLVIQQADAGDIIFFGSSTENMRIKNSGEVGIGTDDPTDSLYIMKNQRKFTGINVVNTSTAGGAYAGIKMNSNAGESALTKMDTTYGFNLAGDTLLQDESGGDISVWGTSTQIARFVNGGNFIVGPAGNLLVGTTTGQSSLTIEKSFNGATLIDVENPNAGSSALSGFKFGTKDGYFTMLQTNDGFGAGTHNDNSTVFQEIGKNIAFYSSTSQMMMMQGLTGNIGIGSTLSAINPQAKLVVDNGVVIDGGETYENYFQAGVKYVDSVLPGYLYISGLGFASSTAGVAGLGGVGNSAGSVGVAGVAHNGGIGALFVSTDPGGMAVQVSAGRTQTVDDIEITDPSKGIIMKDTVTSLCARVQLTSGVLVPTTITCPSGF